MSFKKQCDERVNNLYTLIIKFIMLQCMATALVMFLVCIKLLTFCHV